MALQGWLQGVYWGVKKFQNSKLRLKLNKAGPLLTYKVGGQLPLQSSELPPLKLILPLKKCPFFKRLLFFYWETQRNTTRYNTTLHVLVKIGPFDAICPPSEHLLKEALQTLDQ